ncbi:MAG: diaminopimelate decarboxylase [Pseudomonadota bacterium]
MTGFAYRGGVLHAENVPLPAIAEAVGTPCYVYSTVILRDRYRAYAQALGPLGVRVCYALKANSNQAILRLFAEEGAGMDVVSDGEMRRALAADVAPDHIVFSGVGKTRGELVAALTENLAQINVESREELALLNEVAGSLGRRAPVALRINPDVDARTHAKITTGLRENKFGIDIDHAAEVYRQAAKLPNIAPQGLAMHLGSQLLDLTPYRDAYRKLADLVGALRADGLTVDNLDLGGGIGISYRAGESPPDLAAYAEIVREILAPLGCHMMVEPGRSLVGDAGILLSRVIYRKHGLSRDFLIVDAAMNDLVRPAMYDAWHEILPIAEPAPDAERSAVDIVGPVCESGDTFAKERDVPPLTDGDLLAFSQAGAYSAVMASTYNSRPLVPEVLVQDAAFAIVRKRPTFEEMIALETSPPWQMG